MATYSYKIRNNFNIVTGNTISPMLNSLTGNQEFKEYLTIYSTIPGQQLRPTIGAFGNSLSPDNIPHDELLETNYMSTMMFFDTYSSGNTITSPIKTLNIPINLSFTPTDNSDNINNFIEDETIESINKTIDGERTRYISQFYPGIRLDFRFYDSDNNIFDTINTTGATNGYRLAGFNSNDINLNRNNFKKSFFRLYFYDSNDTKSQNLLIIEDISVSKTKTPKFILDRLYWLKNDELFSGNTQNRITYMEARFFNAKNGRVHRFTNLPINELSPVNVNVVAQNPDWKSSQIAILNPKLNNGNYEFLVIPNVGASTINTITLTEYILKV